MARVEDGKVLNTEVVPEVPVEHPPWGAGENNPWKARQMEIS